VKTRLKSKLDLPDIQPRPPVQATIYKKVYRYLDTQLSVHSARRTNGTSAPSTPSKLHKAQSATPQTGRSARQVKDTPNKTILPHRSPSKSQLQTPRNNVRNIPAQSSITHITPKTPDAEFPPWIMDAIRIICISWKRPSAAPHVFTGVSSVSRLLASQAVSKTPNKSHRTAPSDLEKFSLELIPALAFTIAIYTETRFGNAPEPEEYFEKRSKAYTVFAEHIPRAKDSSTSELDADKGIYSEEISRTKTSRSVSKRMEKDLLMPKIAYEALCEEYNRLADEGWLDMDWYHNICHAAETTKEEDEAAAEAASDDDEMDIDSDGVTTEPTRRGPTLETTTDDLDADMAIRIQRRKRKSPDGEEEELLHVDVHARLGGEMMLAQTGWMTLDSKKKYKKWVEQTRKKIALKKAEYEPV